MAYWFAVAMLAGMSLYYGVRTLLRARRANRTSEQEFNMLESAWWMAGFAFSAALLAGVLLANGGTISSVALTVVVFLGAALSATGAFVHAWTVRRLERLGPDPDYGELDEVPNAFSDDGPIRPTP